MRRVVTYARRADASRLSPVVPVPFSADAAEPPAAAFPQRPGALDWLIGPALAQLEQREDAWQLVVSAPPGAAPGAGLPVVVFLHGGAFVSGAGTVRWYDGTALAAAVGAVVVTVNYRVGFLGHLGAGGLDDANGPVRDNLLALEWVHDNIAAFGGSPDAVTVLGESAGGWHALALARAAAARGLFDRVGVLSTPGQEPLPADEYLEHREEALGRFGGVRGFGAASVADVLDVQLDVVRSRPGIAPFLMPAVDGALVSAGFWSDFAPLHVSRMLVATVADETTAFIARPGAPQPPAEQLDAVIAGSTREGFHEPAQRLLEGAAAAGILTSSLAVSLGSPVAGGRSPHGSILPALFGNPSDWHDAPLLDGVDAARLAALTREVQSAVAALVAR